MVEMKYLQIFSDKAEDLEELNLEDKGELLEAMMAYCFNGTAPKLKTNARFVWPVFRRMIDKSREEYEKQIANGARGGRPKKTQENPTETQAKPSENPTITQQKPNDNPTETQNNQETRNKKQETKNIEEDNTGTTTPRMRTRTRIAILAAAKHSTQLAPHVQALEAYLQKCKAPPELVEHAVYKAIQHAVPLASPIAYIDKLLADYAERGLTTVAEVEEAQSGFSYQEAAW